MASNNFHAGGSADSTVVFGKAVGHLNVFVGTGVTFSISLDKGSNYMTLPSGFYSFPVSPVLEVHVKSSGTWQLVGVQA